MNILVIVEVWVCVEFGGCEVIDLLRIGRRNKGQSIYESVHGSSR